MYKYTCPACQTVLEMAQAAPPGKKIKCGSCSHIFVPRAETLGLAAEEKVAKKAIPSKPAKPVAAAPPPPEEPAVKPFKYVDDDNDVVSYGVVNETEAEKKAAEKNKPKFTDVQEKYKKSARGPASAALVMPTNLLIFAGMVTSLAGIVVIIVYTWNLIFTDAPASDDEILDCIPYCVLGLLMIAWGGLVIYGTFKMASLESYTWALVGAVLGSIPLLVGLFALITLRDPKVIAGFQENEGAVDDDEDGDDDEEDDEEDDEDDD